VSQDEQLEVRGADPTRQPPADRMWGWCRRVTPALQGLLESRMLWMDGADHVVVLVASGDSVLLAYWRGESVIGERVAPASVGRLIARWGAPESV
jgi:hypothetical protein